MTEYLQLEDPESVGPNIETSESHCFRSGVPNLFDSKAPIVFNNIQRPPSVSLTKTLIQPNFRAWH